MVLVRERGAKRGFVMRYRLMMVPLMAGMTLVSAVFVVLSFTAA